MSNLLGDHADAVLVLLRAGAPTGKVYDGSLPDPAPKPPYVVAYINRELPRGAEGNTLDGVSAQLNLRVTLHCVGGDAAAARAMADRGAEALLDVTPTIAGRECGQIALDSSIPPAPDETTGVLVMDQIDVYTLTTFPA